MNITDLELKIIVNIAENLYTPLNGSEPDDPIDAQCWTDTVGSDGPYRIEGKELSGGMSSLNKKKLIKSFSGAEGGTSLTEEGFKVYKKHKAGV